MPRTWAITGGTGYVGSVLVSHLMRRGEKVRVLSRGKSTPPGVENVCGDLSNRFALEQLVDGSDYVVHLAAFVHRPVRHDNDEALCRDINVGGTQNLIDAIAGSRSAPFVVGISTASVYGREAAHASETTAIRPDTAYGVTKAESERLLLQSGLPACVLRPATVLGPGAPGNFERLIRLVRRGVFLQVGSTSPAKSLVPVDDLAEAIIAVCAQATQCAGQTFNVAGGGEILTMREIAGTIASAAGTRLHVLRLPAGPLRGIAGGLDAVLTRLLPATPSFRQMLEAFTTSSVLEDAKLATVTGFKGTAGVRQSIVDSVRALTDRSADHRTRQG